jgi:hypothetical protein
MVKGIKNSFAGLPVSLVTEMLEKSGKIAGDLYGTLREIRTNHDKLRQQLQERGLIQHDPATGEQETLTSCCVDGCYFMENLLVSDLASCTACAIEGLMPPSGEKHWENPSHTALFHTDRQNAKTAGILIALMMEIKLDLAAQAPHGIIFLNGSFLKPFISIMENIKPALDEKESETGRQFLNRIKNSLLSCKTIFDSNEEKKLWVGIPPVNSRKELITMAQFPGSYDDTVLFTMLLSPGEYCVPVKADTSELSRVTELPIKDEKFSAVIEALVLAMGDLHIFYYRPYEWTPVLRFEITSSLAGNSSQLALLLNGIKFQCGIPGIKEPYPVYRASSMVRNLRKALPSLRSSVLSYITNAYSGDIGEIFPLLLYKDSKMGDYDE